MRNVKLLAACLAIGSVSLSALAQNEPAKQPPRPARPADAPQGERPAGPQAFGRPPQLSPEKAKAAWELEATGVAKHVGADEAKAKDVVKAYTEARTSQDAAFEKLRKDMAPGAGDDKGGDKGGGRRGGPEQVKAFDDLNKAEREKLQKSLSGILSADQTGKAMASLGTFNRQWDGMVDTIAGFKLESGKQQSALNAIEEYVVAQSKLRQQMAEGDRDAGRAAMQDARQKLNDALKKDLTEEQFKKFEASVGGGRGMGRGPGAEGGEGGGKGKGKGGGGG